MKQLLLDQVAIITGGNAGIGKAISMKLAQEGAKVAIMGTNAEIGEATISEIQQSFLSTQSQFYRVDVSQTSAVEEKIKEILRDFGQIDIFSE